MGTCAGCILLAKQLINDKKDIKLLKAMNLRVLRNAFGRQKESFEYKIKIYGFEKLYNAVFIRAPLIDKVWGNCKVLSKINDQIIMAKQNKFLALSFHPELTNDLRIHNYFLKMITE
jgi:5'-phosphate synthase pdxT subunit